MSQLYVPAKTQDPVELFLLALQGFTVLVLCDHANFALELKTYQTLNMKSLQLEFCGSKMLPAIPETPESPNPKPLSSETPISLNSEHS